MKLISVKFTLWAFDEGFIYNINKYVFKYRETNEISKIQKIQSFMGFLNNVYVCSRKKFSSIFIWIKKEYNKNIKEKINIF